MGPLTISLVALASTLIAIRVTLAMNLASVLVEYICIAQVSRTRTLAGSYTHFVGVQEIPSTPPKRSRAPGKDYRDNRATIC